MARDRAQSGAKAAAEARKRLARTVRPAELALTGWIEATGDEKAAHAKAVASLAALVEAVGVDQAAALTELGVDDVRSAQKEASVAGAPMAPKEGSAARKERSSMGQKEGAQADAIS